MAYCKDYNTKTIIIPQEEHNVEDFPIVQVYLKEGSNYTLIMSDVTVDGRNKVTVSFPKPTNVKVVIK